MVTRAGTLVQRLDTELAILEAERARIVEQTAQNLASVDAKITALTTARAAMTPGVEAVYVNLKALGYLKET